MDIAVTNIFNVIGNYDPSIPSLRRRQEMALIPCYKCSFPGCPYINKNKQKATLHATSHQVSSLEQMPEFMTVRLRMAWRCKHCNPTLYFIGAVAIFEHFKVKHSTDVKLRLRPDQIQWLTSQNQASS